MKSFFKIRFTALVTVIIFGLSTALYGYSPEAGVEKTVSIEIPETLGHIDVLSAKENTPLILHIQSAHGNYQAEKNIQGILDYLTKKYGFDLLLLEGGIGKINPNYFNFFPENPSLNVKVAETMMKKAELTGSETFLVDKMSRGEDIKIKAFGIENARLYRENRKDFQEVMRSKEKSNTFLKKIEQDVDKNAAETLTPALRNFLKEFDAYEDKKLEPAPFFHVLQKMALKNLNIDLNNNSNQNHWPALTRLFRLDQLKSEIDTSKAEGEKKLLSGNLKKLGISLNIPANNIRFAFEQLMQKLPANFSLEPYKNFRLLIQSKILEEELSASGLFEEVARLKELVIQSSAKTDKERNAIRQLENFKLIQKLFTLSLTRKEFNSLISRRDEIKPLVNEISELYQTAIRFYEGAHKREDAMFQNVLNRMKSLGKKRTILITGGFHADGIEQYAKSKAFSYTRISPRVDINQNNHDYILAMLEAHSGPIQKSQIEEILKLQTRNEIIDEGGSLSYQDGQIKEAIAASLGGVATKALSDTFEILELKNLFGENVSAVSFSKNHRYAFVTYTSDQSPKAKLFDLEEKRDARIDFGENVTYGKFDKSETFLYVGYRAVTGTKDEKYYDETSMETIKYQSNITKESTRVYSLYTKQYTTTEGLTNPSEPDKKHGLSAIFDGKNNFHQIKGLIPNQQLKKQLESDGVVGGAISPDHKTFVAVFPRTLWGQRGFAKTYNSETGMEIPVNITSYPKRIEFAADGKNFLFYSQKRDASGSLQDAAEVINISSKTIRELKYKDKFLEYPKFSPGGNYVQGAYTDSGSHLRQNILFDLESNLEPVGIFGQNAGKIFFSENDTLLAVTSESNSCAVYDLKKIKENPYLKQTLSLWGVHFHIGFKLLSQLSTDNLIQVKEELVAFIQIFAILVKGKETEADIPQTVFDYSLWRNLFSKIQNGEISIPINQKSAGQIYSIFNGSSPAAIQTVAAPKTPPTLNFKSPPKHPAPFKPVAAPVNKNGSGEKIPTALAGESNTRAHKPSFVNQNPRDAAVHILRTMKLSTEGIEEASYLPDSKGLLIRQKTGGIETIWICNTAARQVFSYTAPEEDSFYHGRVISDDGQYLFLIYGKRHEFTDIDAADSRLDTGKRSEIFYQMKVIKLYTKLQSKVFLGELKSGRNEIFPTPDGKKFRFNYSFDPTQGGPHYKIDIVFSAASLGTQTKTALALKTFASITAISGMAYVIYGTPLKATAVAHLGVDLANILIFGYFTVMNDFLGQWLSGRGIVKKQTAWALPLGLVLGVVTWGGFKLTHLAVPNDAPMPVWMADLLRVGGVWMMIRFRTMLYAKMVNWVRKNGKSTEEQDKQFESFWMTRSLSFVKNYSVLKFIPEEFQTVAEGIANQYFQLFYSWSVNKEGFIFKSPAKHNSRLFLAFFFIAAPASWFINRNERGEPQPKEMTAASLGAQTEKEKQILDRVKELLLLSNDQKFEAATSALETFTLPFTREQIENIPVNSLAQVAFRRLLREKGLIDAKETELDKHQQDLLKEDLAYALEGKNKLREAAQELISLQNRLRAKQLSDLDPNRPIYAVIGAGFAGSTVVKEVLSKEESKDTQFVVFNGPLIGGKILDGILPKRVKVKDAYLQGKIGIIGALKHKNVYLLPDHEVGKQISQEDFAGLPFDQVVFAGGNSVPKVDNRVPGFDQPGVYLSTDIYRAYNAEELGFPIESNHPSTETLVKGKDVVIIGGGNVSLDVARIALERGAKQVTLLYQRDYEVFSKFTDPESGALQTGKEERYGTEAAGVKYEMMTKLRKINHSADGKLTSVEIEKFKYDIPAGSPASANLQTLKKIGLISTGEIRTISADLVVFAISDDLDPNLKRKRQEGDKWPHNTDVIPAKVSTPTSWIAAGDAATGGGKASATATSARKAAKRLAPTKSVDERQKLIEKLSQFQASSLGYTAKTTIDFPGLEQNSDYLALKKYSDEQGRPLPRFIALTAHYFAGDFLYFPDAPEVLNSYLRILGITKEPIKAKASVNAFNTDFDLQTFLAYLKKQSVEDSLPLIVQEDVLKSGDADQAAKLIAGALNDKDLLVATVEDQNIPPVISKLHRLSGNRFKIRTLNEKLVSAPRIAEMTHAYKIPPVAVSSYENGIDIQLAEGDKIRLDLRTLVAKGVDPIQVLALIRKISDEPALRQFLFNRAGFQFNEALGAWEVSNAFIIRINSIYSAIQATQRSA